MKKVTVEVPGYTTLPLQLPSDRKPATHYLYLRPHEPRVPTPDTSRCLFLVNVPIDTTEAHIRHLFGTQLSAGRVERVSFEDVPVKKNTVATDSNLAHRNKKRKRITADDLQSQLEDIWLPSTWNRELQKSGSHAIVFFPDIPSMESSLKAASKAARKGTSIVWGEGLPQTVSHLSGSSDTSRTNACGEDEMKELVERQKQKAAGLEDFYRFQSREKRKERQNQLLRRFDEDKRKLRDMRDRRGKIRPE
ncbi:hypothetical protein N7526_006562 [Penicillium atrosanguineum]|nr:hypothetical protein N7526_006562 [Penicillium atrosanguineum]